MNIQEAVLATANRLASQRGDWTFSVFEAVQALPHLNESSVRTHIVSRCCVNAPKNHLHKWAYFRRVGRGRYEVLPKYRSSAPPEKISTATAAAPGSRDSAGRSSVIHAVIRADRDSYSAECMEVAVVTQGGDLDETVRNLREAIKLHLEGEDLAALGLSDHPRVQLIFDAPFSV